MKLFRNVFLLGLILAFVAIPAMAANTDVYNVGTVINLKSDKLSSYANACAYLDEGDYVVYVFKSTIVSDSSNQRHSKPFYIGKCNSVDAYARGITSAASNINVIYHFSYDNRNTWTIVTPATFDALSSTAVGDTIGYEDGAQEAAGFHTGIWLVVEFDGGGTEVNIGEAVTWTGVFQKDGTYVQGAWEEVAQIVNSSNTNP